MPQILAALSKASAAVLDYTVNWLPYLGADTIATSTWSAFQSGITITTSTNTTTTATVWLSGGTAGTTYTITNTITTAGGRTDARDITITIGGRAGMAAMISELRMYCNAGTADYTVAGQTYWNDGQLGDEIDMTQMYFTSVPLEPRLVYQTAGAVSLVDYHIPDYVGQWIEDYLPGTAAAGWVVHNYQGGAVGTANYSVNFGAQRITFAANQIGSMFLLDCQAYDLYAAAANIWRKKASIEATQSFDWKSDNHAVTRSQRYTQALEMVKFYEGKSGVGVGYMVRTDENADQVYPYAPPHPHRPSDSNNWPGGL